MELREPKLTDTDRGAFCCKVGCERSYASGDLIFQIEWEPDTEREDYYSANTQACGEHLASLIPDSAMVTCVYPIQEPQVRHVDILFDGQPFHPDVPCNECGHSSDCATHDSDAGERAATCDCPKSGRFVDVVLVARPQDSRRFQEVKAGEWVKRDDGYWALRIPVNDTWLVG